MAERVSDVDRPLKGDDHAVLLGLLTRFKEVAAHRRTLLPGSAEHERQLRLEDELAWRIRNWSDRAP